MPLSLPLVASCLRPWFSVKLLDLNLHEAADYESVLERAAPYDLLGFRVCAQNFPIARRLSAELKRRHPSAWIIWGGELPTLMPQLCLESADAVVRGRFEPHAAALARDVEGSRSTRVYEKADLAVASPFPAFDLVESPGSYFDFMGVPMETSLGCVHGCAFCLVHSTQEHLNYRSSEQLSRELSDYPRDFVNVVDFNLGNDRKHLIALASVMKDSAVGGWMGELCLESLDDDEILDALAESRCRSVYCGLESLIPGGLKSVAKTQNLGKDYVRIIRKAQRRGIEVACGFILGLEGTTRQSFDDFVDFCEEAGILYLKLTTLTFNPGTKVQASMESQGRYLTRDLSRFDGIRLSFLPRGVDADVVREGARRIIERFYSPVSHWRRSAHLSGSPRKRAEFALFSHCYGQAYRPWLEHDLLDPEGTGVDRLLAEPLRKSASLAICERALSVLRRAA